MIIAKLLSMTLFLKEGFLFILFIYFLEEELKTLMIRVPISDMLEVQGL